MKITNDLEYEKLILSKEELIEKYLESKIEHKKNEFKKMEIENILQKYIVTKNGDNFFKVPENIYADLFKEIKLIIDSSMYIFNEFLHKRVSKDDNGNYVINDVEEKIMLQDAGVKIIPSYVWVFPYKFEIKFQRGTWSYIAAGIGVVSGSVNLL